MVVSCLALTACHTHEFGEWTVVKQPTCTQDGERERFCSCGEKQTSTIAATEHSPKAAVIENNIAPACTTSGSYDSVVYCATCDAKLSRETIEPW